MTLDEEFKSMPGQELYNSKIIDAFIKFIKSKYSYVNISELLEYAGMEIYQIEDHTHWFTQQQVNRFYEKAQQLTGNEHLAREAGRYNISPEAVGTIRKYLLGLVNPAESFEIFSKMSSHFTRSAHFQSRRLSANKVEITVTPNPGIEESPFQCENRMGYIEAVGLWFAHQLPNIEHTECLFKGGNVCRYVVSWRDTGAVRWKKNRIRAGVGLLALCFAFLLYGSFDTALAGFGFTIVIIMALDIYAGLLERQDLLSALHHVRSSTEELIERINTNYNNALLINEIGLALSKKIDQAEVFTSIVELLQKRMDYDRGLILLANKERTVIKFCAGYGYTEEYLSLLKSTQFHLDRPESKGPFVVAFREQKPILVNDIDHIAASLSSKSIDFARQLGTKSFIVCPISYEGACLGILAVDNIKTKRPLLQSDINLLMGIAPEIAISIHSAELIEQREEQFKSTLEVLAKSIDARDFLTAGHSEKVTEYAVGISRELGLPDDYCEMIRVASLLHDYGKIGISDAILKKPGKLTEEEYEEIKTHAEKTRQILLKINFRGIYREVPEIAGAHHEKVDGTGYPKGLHGDAIPLGAKILAVADFFEAVTAKRHYRDPMPVDVALQMLEEKRDVHYDSIVIDAFLGYFSKNGKQPKTYPL
jgi:HD-GYP domain-containing protein (c-di-GMP phosphodiesterase class II)